jgi:succinate dehydrogenase/fumarate reductase flavoprotein subunit
MNGKHYHPGYPQGIWLDSNGERYCNEYWGPIEFRGRPALQMNRDGFFAIYDSKLPEYLQYSVPSHGSTYASDENIASIEEELANALAAGSEGVEGHDLSATYTRYAAETLDELLDLVSDDDTVKANIKASIDRYNELCEKGSDDDFGREGELMFPIKEGPFYCDIKPSEIGWMMCTCGGLVINGEQQVLDEYYHPIKGLFASGNCASGRFGTEYFTPTPGVSLGTTIVLGRECGKSVEKFLNGEI